MLGGRGLGHTKGGGMTRSHPGRSLGIAWRKGEVSRGSVGCSSAVPRRRQTGLAALWWLVLAAAGSSFSVLAVVSGARAAKGIDRCAASHIDPYKAADGPSKVDEVAAASMASMAAKDDGDTHQGPGSLLCLDAGQAARAAGRVSKWRDWVRHERCFADERERRTSASQPGAHTVPFRRPQAGIRAARPGANRRRKLQSGEGLCALERHCPCSRAPRATTIAVPTSMHHAVCLELSLGPPRSPQHHHARRAGLPVAATGASGPVVSAHRAAWRGRRSNPPWPSRCSSSCWHREPEWLGTQPPTNAFDHGDGHAGASASLGTASLGPSMGMGMGMVACLCNQATWSVWRTGDNDVSGRSALC